MFLEICTIDNQMILINTANISAIYENAAGHTIINLIWKGSYITDESYESIRMKLGGNVIRE